jgi:hypothetical protein
MTWFKISVIFFEGFYLAAEFKDSTFLLIGI